MGAGLSGRRAKVKEEKGEAVCDQQGFSVRHGDADVVRARLVGVEPGLDQPILLHSLVESATAIQHAARKTCNMTHALAYA